VRFFVVGVTIIIFSSCLSEPDCLVSASNEVKMVFKKANKDSLKYVKFPVIKSSGTDVIFVADSVTSILLYVDPRATQTTFRFQHENGTTTDTLMLRYNIQDILISPDCGAYRYYSGLQVVAYSFSDTVRITNSTLSNASTVQNVEIKF
jgi:hypothetical protein